MGANWFEVEFYCLPMGTVASGSRVSTYQLKIVLLETLLLIMS